MTLTLLYGIRRAIEYGRHHPASDYYKRLNAAETWLICRVLNNRKGSR